MKKLDITIDCDGVLRDFGTSLIREYHKTYPSHQFVPTERWTQYPLHNYFPIGHDIYHFLVEDAPERIYRNAKPYKGANQFIDKMREQGHRTMLLSWQPSRKIEAITLEWLAEHDIKPDDIIFTKDKHKYKSDVHFDDCLDYLNRIQQEGSSIPVSVTRPWNTEWSGLKVRNLEEAEGVVKWMTEYRR